MDQKELIEKIVAEVVARMGVHAPAEGTQADSHASGAAALRPSELARYIDHTLLRPEATEEQVNKLCDEAAKHHFYSVCVNSSWPSIVPGGWAARA